MPLAKLVQASAAVDAQASLPRAGGIVNAGMSDAAVVCALAASAPRLPFDDAHAGARFGERQRAGKPDDPSTNHGYVNFIHVRPYDTIQCLCRLRKSRCLT